MVSPGAAWTGEALKESAFTLKGESFQQVCNCVACFFTGEPCVCHLRSASDGVHDQIVELLKDTTKRSEGVWGKPLSAVGWAVAFSLHLDIKQKTACLCVCTAAGGRPPGV